MDEFDSLRHQEETSAILKLLGPRGVVMKAIWQADKEKPSLARFTFPLSNLRAVTVALVKNGDWDNLCEQCPLLWNKVDTLREIVADSGLPLNAWEMFIYSMLNYIVARHAPNGGGGGKTNPSSSGVGRQAWVGGLKKVADQTLAFMKHETSPTTVYFVLLQEYLDVFTNVAIKDPERVGYAHQVAPSAGELYPHTFVQAIAELWLLRGEPSSKSMMSSSEGTTSNIRKDNVETWAPSLDLMSCVELVIAHYAKEYDSLCLKSTSRLDIHERTASSLNMRLSSAFQEAASGFLSRPLTLDMFFLQRPLYIFLKVAARQWNNSRPRGYAQAYTSLLIYVLAPWNRDGCLRKKFPKASPPGIRGQGVDSNKHDVDTQSPDNLELKRFDPEIWGAYVLHNYIFYDCLLVHVTCFLTKALRYELQFGASVTSFMELVASVSLLCGVYEEVTDILRDTTMLLQNQVSDFVPHLYIQHDLEEGLLGRIHMASNTLEGANHFRGFIWDRELDGKLKDQSVGSYVYHMRKVLLEGIQPGENVKKLSNSTKVYSPSRKFVNRDILIVKDLCHRITNLFDLPDSSAAEKDDLKVKAHALFSEDSLALMRAVNCDTIPFKNSVYFGYIGDPMWMPASSNEVEELVQPLVLVSQAINAKLGLPRTSSAGAGSIFRTPFETVSAFRLNLRFLASLQVLCLIFVTCSLFIPVWIFKHFFLICAARLLLRLFY